MSSGVSPSKIPWSFPFYLRNALYSNSEWLVSRSFSKQNMRSLRFTRVILCRVNCLVVPTPELPGTAALEPDPSVPDPDPGESTFLFFLGPMAANAVRLASLCLICASSCCCISLAFCFNLSCSGSSCRDRDCVD